MGKLVYLMMFLLLGTISGIAQNKNYPKLVSQFTSAKYQDCIDNALKTMNKEPNELQPVLYCSKSYFELFKGADEKSKLSYLKNSLKYAAKIEKVDKKKEQADSYNIFLEELHKSTLEIAAKTYDGPQKEKSKPIFESLAKVFRDTTFQYYEFFPNPNKKPITNVGVNTSNEKVNQLDSKGLKQGKWTKVYPNGNIAYDVHFKDNVPVGDYKRYHENGKLAIYLKYDEKGEWADALIYNEEAQLTAKGKYHGKVRHGHWIYYKDSVKIIEDNYVEGKRDGNAKAYYPDGKVQDERNYKNDIENGVWKQYYPSGKVRLETRVDSGIRNSVYYVYYESGKLQIKGRYKKDHMDGEWIYYDKAGKELQRINYVMGKTDKQTELEKDENKFFEEIEKNKNRFLDPSNFINNPNDYLRTNGLKQE